MRIKDRWIHQGSDCRFDGHRVHKLGIGSSTGSHTVAFFDFLHEVNIAIPIVVRASALLVIAIEAIVLGALARMFVSEPR